jgi:hypothetical protein
VLDEDTLAKDDVLGYTDVDWKEAYQKPGTWAVNRLFALKNDKKDGKDSGEVYVQVLFAPADSKGEAQACPTLPVLLAEYGRVVGKVEVEVVSASKLKNMDAFGGKIDPFCQVYLSNNSKILYFLIINSQ